MQLSFLLPGTLCNEMQNSGWQYIKRSFSKSTICIDLKILIILPQGSSFNGLYSIYIFCQIQWQSLSAATKALPQHQLGRATADVPQVTDIAVTSRHITSPMAMWLSELLTLLSPLIYMSFLTTETFTEEDWGLPRFRNNPMHRSRLYFPVKGICAKQEILDSTVLILKFVHSKF